jgi:hypothetical protein
MTRVIKPSSESITSIKGDFVNYLSTLESWSEIQRLIPSSNLSLIVDLISGAAVYLLNKNYALRNETYLTTSSMESSVFQIARPFGYSIKRFTCPKVTVKYMGIPTIQLTSGTILGRYGDYDLIYFGEPKYLEKLDEVNLCIGHYVEKEVSLTYEDEIIKIPLFPSVLEAIDNDLLSLTHNNLKLSTSTDVEDYVINGKIVDYSMTSRSTELVCSDRTYKYGIDLDTSKPMNIRFIETDGLIDDIDPQAIALESSDYIVIDIPHKGSNGQTLAQMKKLIPLFYSTQRRMVTTKDHQYIIESHQYIKSARAEKDPGKLEQLKIKINSASTANGYDFDLNNKPYVGNLTGTVSQQLTQLAEALKYDPVIKVLSIESDHLLITNKISRRLSSFYFRNDKLLTETVIAGVSPRCCTVNVYYIKYNTVNTPLSLTGLEQTELSNYIDYYKLVGSRINLIPASEINIDIDISVELKDNSYYNQVIVEVEKILNSYTLILKTEFDYNELLTKISQIKLLNQVGENFNPVVSVFYNTNSYNPRESIIQGRIDSYLTFNLKPIKIVEEVIE